MSSTAGHNRRRGKKSGRQRNSNPNATSDRRRILHDPTTRSLIAVVRLERRFEHVQVMIRNVTTVQKIQILQREIEIDLIELKKAHRHLPGTRNETLRNNVTVELERTLEQCRIQVKIHEKIAFEVLEQDEAIINEFIAHLQEMSLEELRATHNRARVARGLEVLTKSVEELERILCQILREVYPKFHIKASRGQNLSRRDIWIQALMRRYPPENNYTVPERHFEDMPVIPGTRCYTTKGKKVHSEECKKRKKDKTVPKDQSPDIFMPDENDENKENEEEENEEEYETLEEEFEEKKGQKNEAQEKEVEQGQEPTPINSITSEITVLAGLLATPASKPETKVTEKPYNFESFYATPMDYNLVPWYGDTPQSNFPPRIGEAPRSYFSNNLPLTGEAPQPNNFPLNGEALRNNFVSRYDEAPRSHNFPLHGEAPQPNNFPLNGEALRNNFVSRYDEAPRSHNFPLHGEAPQPDNFPLNGEALRNNFVSRYDEAPRSHNFPLHGEAPQPNNFPLNGEALRNNFVSRYDEAPRSNNFPLNGEALRSNFVTWYDEAPRSNNFPLNGEAPQPNNFPLNGKAPRRY